MVVPPSPIRFLFLTSKPSVIIYADFCEFLQSIGHNIFLRFRPKHDSRIDKDHRLDSLALTLVVQPTLMAAIRMRLAVASSIRMLPFRFFILSSFLNSTHCMRYQRNKEKHQEYDEKNFRHSCCGYRDSGKAQHCCNQGQNQKHQRVMQHRTSIDLYSGGQVS